MQGVIQETKQKMQKALDMFKAELGRIRTGRASLSLLDGVRVSSYGTMMALNQVGTLAIADSRLITIAPWDKSLIPEIEKAILKADLGLQPANDGVLIRLPIPALNEERRKDLVRQLSKVGEDIKVGIRNVRRDANELLKKKEKEDGLSEDDHRRASDEVQKLTDKFIKDVDAMASRKEKEILEV